MKDFDNASFCTGIRNRLILWLAGDSVVILNSKIEAVRLSRENVEWCVRGNFNKAIIKHNDFSRPEYADYAIQISRKRGKK